MEDLEEVVSGAFRVPVEEASGVALGIIRLSESYGAAHTLIVVAFMALGIFLLLASISRAYKAAKMLEGSANMMQQQQPSPFTFMFVSSLLAIAMMQISRLVQRLHFTVFGTSDYTTPLQYAEFAQQGSLMEGVLQAILGFLVLVGIAMIGKATYHLWEVSAGSNEPRLIWKATAMLVGSVLLIGLSDLYQAANLQAQTQNISTGLDL